MNIYYLQQNAELVVSDFILDDKPFSCSLSKAIQLGQIHINKQLSYN